MSEPRRWRTTGRVDTGHNPPRREWERGDERAWTDDPNGPQENESKWAVDVPNPHNLTGEMICLDYFETREAAIEYAHDRLGADDQGRIQVVSELPTD